MRPGSVVFLGLLSGFCNLAPAAGQIGSGKDWYTTCAACHGAQAQGKADLEAPRLSHLAPVYLASQLRKSRSGQRGGGGASASAVQMAATTATLADDQAVEDVAAYIAALDGGVSAAVVEGNTEPGGDYYNQFCGACHGAAAEGNRALNSPRLAGTDDWHLLAQLQGFRAGQRGTHPDDLTGQQMRAMAAILPNDRAMKDVVAFIRGLEN
jgi:cytochrome c553